MSIADKITSMTNHLEKDYQALELVVGTVSVNKNIENIAPLLDNLWEDLPKTTGSGTSPSISDTRAGKMKLSLKGNTSQTGTPTPDNPIPVNVVSGDNEVVVSNSDNTQSSTYPINLPVENLASLETTGTSIGGVSFTKENGVININGTTNSSSNFYFNSFRTKSGTATYWVEVTGYTDKVSGNCSIILQQSTDNSTWSLLSDISLKSTATHQDSVTLDSSKYYRIRWYTENNTFTNATIKIQLEYGNKKNSFTPYGTTPIEMCDINDNRDKFIRNSGKNMFDGIMELGILDGDTGQPVSNSSYMRCKDFIPVKELTDYSIKSIDIADINLAVYEYKEDYSYNLSSNKIIYNGNTLLTTNSGTKFIKFRPMVANTDLSSRFMVNEGSTLLPYEPYGNGDWYKESKIGKVVLDGSETSGWDGTTGDDNKLFRYTLINDSGKKGNQSIGYCNYFICSYNNVIGNYYFNTTSPCKVCFCVSNDYTLDTFKVWLGTHNTSVYYQLATPTYTKIEGTLAEQLEDVWRAYSYKGQTNISQSNNDLPFELSITALEG